MKLWLMIVAYAAAIAIVFAYKQELADWMTAHQPPVFVAFGFALGLVLFPVLPYKIVIGMLGFLYGPLPGFLVSWSAATVASVLLYTIVRANFQKRGRAYMAKFARMEKAAKLMEKHPFAAILTARLVPVFPQALVNIYPAFLSIRLRTYVLASALGKIPAILLFSYLGEQLFANMRNALIVNGVYALLVALAAIGYRVWARRA